MSREMVLRMIANKAHADQRKVRLFERLKRKAQIEFEAMKHEAWLRSRGTWWW